MVRISDMVASSTEEFKTPAAKKSKSRRKSVLFSPGKSLLEESDLNDNNDETEKSMARKARKEQDERRRSISSPYKSPRKGRKSIGGRAVEAPISETELVNIYTNCLKMSSENKVNIKNAFNLGLIDYMDNLVTNKKEDETNFQKASCTLDAGVKIYSYRVDAVYNEVVKVLGDLSSSKTKKEEVDEDEENNDGEAVKAKVRRVRENGTNLAKSEELNQAKFESEFCMDPLFQKMSKSMDEGGAKGLLVNNLGVHRGCRIVFDSQDAVESKIEIEDGTEGTSPVDDEYVDVAAFASTLRAFAKEEVTPRLGLFAKKYQKEIGIDYGTYTSPAGFDEEQNTLDNTPVDDMDVYDGPCDADYGLDYGDDDSCSGIEARDSLSGDASVQEQVLQKALNDDEDAGTFRRSSLSRDADIFALAEGAGSDYSFFDKNLVKNWAGPAHWSHWKASVGRTVGSSGSQSNATENKKKEPKDAFSIDFYANDVTPAALDQAKQPKTNLLSTKPTNGDSLLLPEDHNYQVAALFKLFLKPNTQVRRRTVYRGGKVDGTSVANGIWYQYDNPNDENNYCPGGVENDDDFGADANTYDDDYGAGFTQLATTDELVEMPTTVNKTSIGYARTSTKVDIKALKGNIWELIGPGDEEESGNGKKASKEGLTSFKEVCASVPELAKASEVDAISVPYCFICLLHLANENGLTITDQEDMSDLTISRN